MLTARMDPLAPVLSAEQERIARRVTAGMRKVTSGVTDDVRDQVRRAGLGARLANTWRGITYPREGYDLRSAAFVYSRAPKIMISFSTGPTVRPQGGRRYLWIPTENVPRAGRRGSATPATPQEVEARFGPFFFRAARRGGLLAYVARSARRRAVHMFTLKRAVKMPNLIGLDATAKRWSVRAPDIVAREIER